jgi:hypothetical protein
VGLADITDVEVAPLISRVIRYAACCECLQTLPSVIRGGGIRCHDCSLDFEALVEGLGECNRDEILHAMCRHRTSTAHAGGEADGEVAQVLVGNGRDGQPRFDCDIGGKQVTREQPVAGALHAYGANKTLAAARTG